MPILDSVISIFTRLFTAKKGSRFRRKKNRRPRALPRKKRSRLKNKNPRRLLKRPIKRLRLRQAVAIKRKGALRKKSRKLTSDSLRISSQQKSSARFKNNIKKTVLNEQVRVGEVTHYFSKIMVGVVKVMHQPLRIGDRVRFKGASTDFEQTVKSLQVESRDVQAGKPGQLVGLKVNAVTKPGDKVYRIKVF